MRASSIGGATLVAAAITITAISTASAPQAQETAQPTLAVYKTATCGCCSKWVDHMKAAGFDVKAQNVDDIGRVKSTYGVPAEIGSCHTSLVGGYVVEGHVPADAVKRMLKEKPAIAGIAVPGMPIGSPGMEQGGRTESYSIVAFDKSGKQTVFERR